MLSRGMVIEFHRENWVNTGKLYINDEKEEQFVPLGRIFTYTGK